MPAIDVEFHDERISMLYWFPCIRGLNVPIVQTEFFSLNTESTFELRGDGSDLNQFAETLNGIPVDEISNFVGDLPTEKAHIRSDLKASRLAGGEGRTITRDHRVIHEQVMHLVDSMNMMNVPFRSLVVRELIDVDEVARSYNTFICPEVRFIVDEGEVLDGFVDVCEEDFDTSFTEKEVQTILDDFNQRLDSEYEKLSLWAEIVAEEMSDTGWSIDFIQDSNGKWYIIDMALYGLYWNELKNQWKNISHIPTGKPYNLEENLPDSLPETPKKPYNPT